MSFFRRKARSTSANSVPVNSYEEAEANPELIAAEEQVNQLPSSARLVNPIIETSPDPHEHVAGPPKEEGSSRD